MRAVNVELSSGPRRAPPRPARGLRGRKPGRSAFLYRRAGHPPLPAVRRCRPLRRRRPGAPEAVRCRGARSPERRAPRTSHEERVITKPAIRDEAWRASRANRSDTARERRRIRDASPGGGPTAARSWVSRSDGGHRGAKYRAHAGQRSGAGFPKTNAPPRGLPFWSQMAQMCNRFVPWITFLRVL